MPHLSCTLAEVSFLACYMQQTHILMDAFETCNNATILIHSISNESMRPCVHTHLLASLILDF